MWNKGPIFSWPHRVTVQNITAESFDESGDLVAETTDSFQSVAFVDTSLGGREFRTVTGGKTDLIYSAVVYLPNQAGVLPTSRIVWEGRTFEVAAPIDFGFGYVLSVPCAEVVR